MVSTTLRPSPRGADCAAPSRGPATGRLEYRLALDVAFSAVMTRSKADAPVVSIASTRPLCYESALRVRPIDTVACEQPWTVDVPSPSVLRPVEELSAIEPGVGGVIWFSPGRLTWQERLAEIDRILMPGGVVATLTAGSGSIFTPLRRDWSEGEPDWSGCDVRDAFLRAGYRPCGRLELAGASSVFWVVLQRACSLVGRLDLSDRYEVAYRLSIAGRLRRVLPQFVLTLHQRGAAA